MKRKVRGEEGEEEEETGRGEGKKKIIWCAASCFICEALEWRHHGFLIPCSSYPTSFSNEGIHTQTWIHNDWGPGHSFFHSVQKKKKEYMARKISECYVLIRRLSVRQNPLSVRGKILSSIWVKNAPVIFRIKSFVFHQLPCSHFFQSQQYITCRGGNVFQQSLQKHSLRGRRSNICKMRVLILFYISQHYEVWTYP